MAAPASAWSRLGDALGGDSELAYQEGLALGAKTENALATAREKVDKSKAQMRAEEDMVAAGIPRAQAKAMSTMQVAGGSYKDLGDILAGNQTRDFRATAGDPTKSFMERNIALQGVASGPVERWASAGEGVWQDKFSNGDPTVSPLGEALVRQREAAAKLDDERRMNPERFRSASSQFVVTPAGVFKPTDGDLAPTAVTAETLANAAGARDVAKADAKAYANLPQSFAKYRSATDNAKSVLGDIDKALGMNGWDSAGLLGWATREAPGTPALALNRIVDSIKANVGFQQLSGMRHESPTGGALGNVTEQELKFLQSAIASLDTAQNPEQLAEALAKVRDHYTRYQQYAADDYELAQARAARFAPQAGAAPTPAPASPPSSGPAVGTVEDGFRFKGGNPADPNSWEPVQ